MHISTEVTLDPETQLYTTKVTTTIISLERPSVADILTVNTPPPVVKKSRKGARKNTASRVITSSSFIQEKLEAENLANQEKEQKEIKKNQRKEKKAKKLEAQQIIQERKKKREIEKNSSKKSKKPKNDN
jgi:hypothetical protein